MVIKDTLKDIKNKGGCNKVNLMKILMQQSKLNDDINIIIKNNCDHYFVLRLDILDLQLNWINDDFQIIDR